MRMCFASLKRVDSPERPANSIGSKRKPRFILAICVQALEHGFDGRGLRIIAGLVTNPGRLLTRSDIRSDEIDSAFRKAFRIVSESSKYNPRLFDFQKVRISHGHSRRSPRNSFAGKTGGWGHSHKRILFVGSGTCAQFCAQAQPGWSCTGEYSELRKPRICC